MTTKLSVNLNAVAMLRNRRNLPWPSVTHVGMLALQAGAYGLTVHPRPDQRHIRFSDLPDLRALTLEHSAEFNVEGYPTQQFIGLVAQHRPDQVTLVPDDPSQSTSDHGWDFLANLDFLTTVVEKLHQFIPRVSLFCDPDSGQEQLMAAKATGAERIELYTGPYGAMHGDPDATGVELTKLSRTAEIARGLDLGVNAGHDLTVSNLPQLIQSIPDLLEVSIGHALIADAVEFGIQESVRRFIQAMRT